MVLVVGVGIVGKAVIDYYKKNYCCEELEFFDDNINFLPSVAKFEPSETNWKKVELVVISPGVPLGHNIIQEAIKRRIKITNDISIFLTDHTNGIKIGITGTVGKSTTCALLKHVLGNTAAICGNFGISPLSLPESEFYIIELSSFQLEQISQLDLEKLDIGAITNIFPHHIDRHGSYNDYMCAKCKILAAQNKILGICKTFANWKTNKAVEVDVYPNSPLFEHEEYKMHWALIVKILEILKFDIQIALKNAESYKSLPFRQEIVTNKPIMIINDSKGTTPIASIQSCNNMKNNFCWIVGGVEIQDEEWDIPKDTQKKIKKVFIYGDFPKLISVLNKEIEVEQNESGIEGFEKTIIAAMQYCIKNKLNLLFSPGCNSFDAFKNFEHRGLEFNKFVKIFLDSL